MVEEMINEARATLGESPEQIDITLHTDNDSVFKSKHHAAKMASMGVRLHYADPYEARTNPFTERFGGTLIAFTRAMMQEGCYPPKFWSVLVRAACWTINRLVRKDNTAPIETFAKQKIDFSKAHPTGTLCYWSVDKKHRDDPKLGNAAAVGVYICPAEQFGARITILNPFDWEFLKNSSRSRKELPPCMTKRMLTPSSLYCLMERQRSILLGTLCASSLTECGFFLV
jgi:hypothetical protein